MALDSRGKIYIVGTPIGNLNDITIRALNTLKEVDIILAEDTRQTLKLLNHFEISKTLISYHRHNEDDKIQTVKNILDEGKNLALVSDAGMPIISDPGSNLIKYLIENSYEIAVIPGVTALITGIVKSGMDSTRFSFEGFLSVNKKQRKERLEELKKEIRTMVFYEAPHKILYTLKDMYEVFGNRKICIARELTKIHEEYIYTTLDEAIKQIEENGIKGEIVLVVEGIDKTTLQEEKNKEIIEKDTKELVLEKMNEGTSKKDAIKQVARLKSVSRNEVYQECLDL